MGDWVIMEYFSEVKSYRASNIIQNDLKRKDRITFLPLGSVFNPGKKTYIIRITPGPTPET